MVEIVFFIGLESPSMLKEYSYCSNLCKYIDPTLTDANIEVIWANDFTEFLSIYRNKYKRQNYNPIVVSPTPSASSLYRAQLENSDIPMCLPYIGLNPGGGGYQNPYPTLSNNTPYSGISPIVSTSGGESGDTDWLYGDGLEFVESSGGYISPVYFNGDNYPLSLIDAVQQDGIYTRFRLTQQYNLITYLPTGWRVHISGVTGFSNNPNGTFIIQKATNAGYLWPIMAFGVTHNLGSGSYDVGTGICKQNYLSGSCSIVATKLSMIMRGRQCSFKEARMVARITGSQNNVWTQNNGYGSINVANAIAYSGSIPDYPYDATLESIKTLSGSYDGTKVSLNYGDIKYAKKYQFFMNDVKIKEASFQNGLPKTIDISPVTIGVNNFKYRALRDTKSDKTDYSNIIQLTCDLQDYPKDYLYAINEDVYIWEDDELIIVKVESRRYELKGNSNLPQQINYYKFFNKENELVEENVFRTKNCAFVYINNMNRLGGLFFEITRWEDDVDLTGILFNYQTDFSLNSFDFTGLRIDYTDFSFSIPPNDITSKADLKSKVLSWHPVHTKYFDGTEMGY